MLGKLISQRQSNNWLLKWLPVNGALKFGLNLLANFGSIRQVIIKLLVSVLEGLQHQPAVVSKKMRSEGQFNRLISFLRKATEWQTAHSTEPQEEASDKLRRGFRKAASLGSMSNLLRRRNSNLRASAE